ncbi:AP-3 complex subunit mu [Nakaseomyces bracarensis]|uniref:AP-3 complex subunit mu n=1 Tax=Nakaseomyces bracarensis TaxID=273131 RepID=A0ABR4NMC8_9SACH
MYYQAVYISDSEHRLVFQHFLNSTAPTYDKIWGRLSSMCPWLVNEAVGNDQSRDGGVQDLNAGDIGREYRVYKRTVKSENGKLNYWALCSKDTDDIAIGEPYFVLEQFHEKLLEYFDKDSLSVSKITNNADRVSVICNYLMNGGYYNVSGMYDSRIKQIIPERSDFSKIISSTAHHLQSVVQKQRPVTGTSTRNGSGFGYSPGQGQVQGPGPGAVSGFGNGNRSGSSGSSSHGQGQAHSEGIVPWRSGKNPQNELNDLYVDIKETLHVIYQKSPNRTRRSTFQKSSSTGVAPTRCITGQVEGSVDVRCFLRGNPLVEINFKNEELGTPSLHDCVDKRALLGPDGDEDVGKDETESQPKALRQLRFIPPEGRFTLMKYKLDHGPKTHRAHLVEADIEDHLGIRSDEFQVTLNISSSTTTKHIEDLHVTIHFTGTENYKVKPLQITHGRLENLSPHTSRWIFDRELSTGTLPVLRGCIETTHDDSETNTQDSPTGSLDTSTHPGNATEHKPSVQSLSLTYHHTGHTLLQVQSINVDGPTQHDLFKGVKYHTVAADYQIRV